MKDSDGIGTTYSFSYTTYSASHEFYETPQQSTLNPGGETIPLAAFSHDASAMQAIARYMVDVRKHSFTQAARLLGRSPKSVWTSYHQTGPLPGLAPSLQIPIGAFIGKPPLEALVSYLKATGMRNTDIAQALRLSPKTTWTAAKRAEVKR